MRDRGRYGPVLSALQWAYIDGGRWDQTLSTARETADTAAAYKMDTIAASADLATATVLALRGHHDQVPPLVASALARIDATADRATAARAWHAASLAALAAAATRPATHGSARSSTPTARRCTITSPTWPSPISPPPLPARSATWRRRRSSSARSPRWIRHREHGWSSSPPAPACCSPGTPAPRPTPAKVLADPAGDAWPFERAQLQLDYGEWLRRQRRINDAKPVLAAALETLRGLGAAPWIRRAEAELRACGVTAQAPNAAPDALADLTPQQRQIVILAGRGLTNGEIADRLFLSPRTVASHLYNSYPKLGIAGRHQLRDLIDQAPSR